MTLASDMAVAEAPSGLMHQVFALFTLFLVIAINEVIENIYGVLLGSYSYIQQTQTSSNQATVF